jgi:tetratricopeptide (TPR) repeat protein
MAHGISPQWVSHQLGFLENKAHESQIVGRMALYMERLGHFQKARDLYERQLGCLSNYDDGTKAQEALDHLIELSIRMGDNESNMKYLTDRLNIARQDWNPVDRIEISLRLAELHTSQEQIEAAESLHLDSLSLAERIGYKPGIADILFSMAKIQLRRGNHEKVMKLCTHALETADSMGDKMRVAVIGDALKKLETVMREMASAVFLSYAREDQSRVEEVYDRLAEAGLRLWMDKRDLLGGEQWKYAIMTAINSADFVLICLTQMSVNKRGYLQTEIRESLELWRQKLEEDIYLISVRLGECAVPDRLRPFQWIDLFQKGGFEGLVRAIQEGMRRRSGQ